MKKEEQAYWRPDIMNRIWVLVMVKRGFIEEPEIFLDKRLAQARRRELLQDFNPDYDEIDIFRKTLPLPSPVATSVKRASIR
jgi:hypothetical protein